jgi:hypothetical protein
MLVLTYKPNFKILNVKRNKKIEKGGFYENV